MDGNRCVWGMGIGKIDGNVVHGVGTGILVDKVAWSQVSCGPSPVQ